MGMWIGRLTRAAAKAVFALLCAAVAVYAFHYLYGSFRPRNPFDQHFAVAGLAVPAHFFGAGLALLLAPLQLSAAVRRGLPRLHRVAGWLYAAGVLIGGLGGLLLARNAHGGVASGSGFALLAVVWLASTGLGIRHAIAGDHARHQRWMWRSVALTSSAVTLRLMLAVGQGVLHLPFVTVYVAAAWLCWTVNLALLEGWLRWRDRALRSATPQRRSILGAA